MTAYGAAWRFFTAAQGDGSRVTQPRVPILAAPFRRHVEDVPERPDHVDVSRVLPFLCRREEQLAVPEMANAAVAACEDVHRRRLIGVRVLALIVAVVRVARRREQPQVAPSARTGELLDPLGRRLRDDGE